MADFLIYWKYFWRDISKNPESFNELWHTRQEGVFNKIKPYDSLWIVISAGAQYPGEWRLLQRIIVKQTRTLKDKSSRPYKVIGYEEKGQKFDVDSQHDLGDLLRSLTFTRARKFQHME